MNEKQEQYQLRLIAKAVGGQVEGRGFPEFVIAENKGFILVFGYANENLGCDIYKNKNYYEHGISCNSLDAGTNDCNQNIGWAFMRVTGGAI